MKWTKSRLKTLVDSARGINPCDNAVKFIEHLDKDYETENEPNNKTNKKTKSNKKNEKSESLLDTFLDYLFEKP